MDLKVKYFSLEISKLDKMAQMMSYKLLVDYNILIGPLNLLSIFQGIYFR